MRHISVRDIAEHFAASCGPNADQGLRSERVRTLGSTFKTAPRDECSGRRACSASMYVVSITWSVMSHEPALRVSLAALYGHRLLPIGVATPSSETGETVSEPWKVRSVREPTSGAVVMSGGGWIGVVGSCGNHACEEGGEDTGHLDSLADGEVSSSNRVRAAASRIESTMK